MKPQQKTTTVQAAYSGVSSTADRTVNQRCGTIFTKIRYISVHQQLTQYNILLLGNWKHLEPGPN